MVLFDEPVQQRVLMGHMFGVTLFGFPSPDGTWTGVVATVLQVSGATKPLGTGARRATRATRAKCTRTRKVRTTPKATKDTQGQAPPSEKKRKRLDIFSNKVDEEYYRDPRTIKRKRAEVMRQEMARIRRRWDPDGKLTLEELDEMVEVWSAKVKALELRFMQKWRRQDVQEMDPPPSTDCVPLQPATEQAGVVLEDTLEIGIGEGMVKDEELIDLTGFDFGSALEGADFKNVAWAGTDLDALGVVEPWKMETTGEVGRGFLGGQECAPVDWVPDPVLIQGLIAGA